MALRAGYYGLKRFERNKLSILAASTPADISPDNPIAGKNDVLASIDLIDDTVGWVSKNLFITKNGSGTTDSGLTESEVEIIATRITKDTIDAPYINGLNITAKDISAKEITGKNIKSSTNSWYINDSGSFQLGGSNGIRYNGSGQITFGSDVALS